MKKVILLGLSIQIFCSIKIFSQHTIPNFLMKYGEVKLDTSPSVYKLVNQSIENADGLDFFIDSVQNNYDTLKIFATLGEDLNGSKLSIFNLRSKGRNSFIQTDEIVYQRTPFNKGIAFNYSNCADNRVMFLIKSTTKPLLFIEIVIPKE